MVKNHQHGAIGAAGHGRSTTCATAPGVGLDDASCPPSPAYASSTQLARPATHDRGQSDVDAFVAALVHQRRHHAGHAARRLRPRVRSSSPLRPAPTSSITRLNIERTRVASPAAWRSAGARPQRVAAVARHEPERRRARGRRAPPWATPSPSSRSAAWPGRQALGEALETTAMVRALDITQNDLSTAASPLARRWVNSTLHTLSMRFNRIAWFECATPCARGEHLAHPSTWCSTARLAPPPARRRQELPSARCTLNATSLPSARVGAAGGTWGSRARTSPKRAGRGRRRLPTPSRPTARSRRSTYRSGIGADGCAEIVAGVAVADVATLILDRNAFGDAGGEALAAALRPAPNASPSSASARMRTRRRSRRRCRRRLSCARCAQPQRPRRCERRGVTMATACT